MRNEYEDDLFFAQYAQMPRSREGLPAAGEWHQLRLLLPSLKGKRVLSKGLRKCWTLT